MDETAVEALGAAPLQDALARIAAMKSKAELPALLAQLQRERPSLLSEPG